MKRKVKSWEDLLKVGEHWADGRIRGPEGTTIRFNGETMRRFCGTFIDYKDENTPIDMWYFEEWMLEPLENTLRNAVQEVIDVLEEPDGVPNTTYILNRLKTALND